MRAHLLINVFVTPIGLNKFKIEKIKSESETFRIDRFLTACSTFNSVPWDSVLIHLKLDSCWMHLEPDVHSALKVIFPSALIMNYRLEKRSEWEEVSKRYPDGDVILLQANDDHAVVCQDSNYLSEYLNIFYENSRFDIAALTHFPEMQTLISNTSETNGITSERLQSGRIHYAIGTQLVKSSFFKSWWQEGKIKNDTYIFRPDNPFGESVVFKPTEMLIPKMELFRHLDGYGHIGMHRPLGPLRNLGNLDEFIRKDFLAQPWTLGLWPSRVIAYSGSGYDMHDTYSHLGGINKLRIGVALLQSHWALKYMPFRAKEILSSLQVNNFIFVISTSIVATLSFPILRNVPDFLIEETIRFLKTRLFNLHRWPKAKIYNATYLGVWRTVRQKFIGLKKRFKSL